MTEKPEQKIVIHRDLSFTLGMVTEDNGAVHFERFLRLSPAHALALLQGDAGIGQTGFRFSRVNEHVPAQQMQIRKVVNHEPGTRPWALYVGDELAGRISDEHVRALIEHANPVLEPDQPNWKVREMEDIEHQINLLYGNISHINESIAQFQERHARLAQENAAAEHLPEARDTPAGEMIALSGYLRESGQVATLTVKNGYGHSLNIQGGMTSETTESLFAERMLRLGEHLIGCVSVQQNDEEPSHYDIRLTGKDGPWYLPEGTTNESEINLAPLEVMRFADLDPEASPEQL